MRYGLYLPNFGAFADPHVLVAVAREAEQSGWDGFFVWDHVARGLRTPVLDPWVGLAAVAVATERMRIGALVTPLARRRPWKLARETVSLDRLSRGRLVFGAGLGSGHPAEWDGLGEDAEARVRAGRLDEGLELLVRFWSGERVDFHGSYYRVDAARFEPTPLQRPRIPIWIAGYWPHRAPLRRAARFDGVFPLFRESPPGDVPLLAEAAAYVRARRDDGAAFDVVHLSHAGPDADPAAAVEPYARAGATWWLERLTPDAFGATWEGPWPVDAMRARIRQGPPA